MLEVLWNKAITYLFSRQCNKVIYLVCRQEIIWILAVMVVIVDIVATYQQVTPTDMPGKIYNHISQDGIKYYS